MMVVKKEAEHPRILPSLEHMKIVSVAMPSQMQQIVGLQKNVCRKSENYVSVYFWTIYKNIFLKHSQRENSTNFNHKRFRFGAAQSSICCIWCK